MPEQNRSHDDYLDLCAGAALDSLAPADRQRFEAHLRGGCTQCQTLLDDLRRTAATLPYAVDPVTPAPRVKQRVLEQIRAERSSARDPGAPQLPDARAVGGRTRGRGTWRWWIAASGWAAALLIGFFAMRDRQDLQEARQQLEGAHTQLLQTQDALTQLESQVRSEKLWGDVFVSRESEIVVLLPTEKGSPDLRARATYDPETQRAVIVFENLTAPQDRNYQLWAIKDGVPASLGVIHSVRDGYAVLRLAEVGAQDALTAFAVSLEKTGGSSRKDQPEGEVVLVGSRGTN